MVWREALASGPRSPTTGSVLLRERRSRQAPPAPRHAGIRETGLQRLLPLVLRTMQQSPKRSEECAWNPPVEPIICLWRTGCRYDRVHFVWGIHVFTAKTERKELLCAA